MLSRVAARTAHTRSGSALEPRGTARQPRDATAGGACRSVVTVAARLEAGLAWAVRVGRSANHTTFHHKMEKSRVTSARARGRTSYEARTRALSPCWHLLGRSARLPTAPVNATRRRASPSVARGRGRRTGGAAAGPARAPHPAHLRPRRSARLSCCVPGCVRIESRMSRHARE